MDEICIHGKTLIGLKEKEKVFAPHDTAVSSTCERSNAVMIKPRMLAEASLWAYMGVITLTVILPRTTNHSQYIHGREVPILSVHYRAAFLNQALFYSNLLLSGKSFKFFILEYSSSMPVYYMGTKTRHPLLQMMRARAGLGARPKWIHTQNSSHIKDNPPSPLHPLSTPWDAFPLTLTPGSIFGRRRDCDDCDG